MEPVVRPFHEIVQARLDELGENPFAMANKASISYDKLRSVLRNDGRRTDPKLEKAREICAALGLELYIGPPRETGPVERVEIAGEEFAHIPLHQAMLSAGAGAYNGQEEVIDHLAFRKDWLTRMGLAASMAGLARVHGDSMQPTLWPGDMVLIDTRITEPKIRKKDRRDQRRAPVYAIIDGGEARVKRIERPSEDVLMLISDNPDYSPEFRQGDDLKNIRVVGKVVWWGHTVKE
ncbi:S24 family peptidase [Paracoccus onubensis]|uniref:S24 family peptidase n=2 Tax=Paracoccus onubensis TaxID=1675788 RepID=A0A418T2E4_9RHOB|nr:S24 family peptidase [Paracoccus onubensis]